MATVDKRGKKYRVRYAVYENGKRIQRNKSFSTAREAKEYAAKVEHEIDTGQYSYTKGRTLADVLNEWLEVYCVHLRPNALADMKTAVRVHLIPHLGNVPLESVTTGMIQKLYNDMMKTECLYYSSIVSFLCCLSKYSISVIITSLRSHRRLPTKNGSKASMVISDQWAKAFL